MSKEMIENVFQRSGMSKEHIAEVRELLESLGYVQLAEDQSLPQLITPASCNHPADYRRGVRNTMGRMLNAGFKKVKK